MQLRRLQASAACPEGPRTVLVSIPNFAEAGTLASVDLAILTRDCISFQ